MTRHLLRSLLVFVVATAVNGCWLQPGFGPHRAGHSSGEKRLTASNASGLAPAWSVDLGSSAVLDPVVTSHGVHAVSGLVLSTRLLDSGDSRWSVPVLSPENPDLPVNVAAPSVRNGEVLVPADVYQNFEPGSGTHAYNTMSGEGGRIVAGPVNGSMTVLRHTLAGTVRQLAGRIAPNFVRVADLSDPSNNWSSFLGVDGPLPTTVAMGQSRILLGVGPVLNAYTRQRPSDCSMQNGVVICLPVWSRSLGGAATVPVLSEDESTVYVGDSAGGLWALSAADGSVLWTAKLGTDGAPAIVATPTLSEEWLYVTASDGRLWAFDAHGCGASTCRALWAGATGSPIDKQAASAGGVIYLGSQDGTVNAYRASGCGANLCSPLWKASTGSRITGGPVVADGHLLVGTEDGRLIAYRPS